MYAEEANIGSADGVVGAVTVMSSGDENENKQQLTTAAVPEVAIDGNNNHTDEEATMKSQMQAMGLPTTFCDRRLQGAWGKDERKDGEAERSRKPALQVADSCSDSDSMSESDDDDGELPVEKSVSANDSNSGSAASNSVPPPPPIPAAVADLLMTARQEKRKRKKKRAGREQQERRKRRKEREERARLNEQEDHDDEIEQEDADDELDNTEHDTISVAPPSRKKRKKRQKNHNNRQSSEARLRSEAKAAGTEKKYWVQRYAAFTRFDEGIQLDTVGWYSVTPERIAAHQAERCRADTIIDAFAGVGGNAIQFAMTCYHVIAIELDPIRLAMARHNAQVYGVADRIDFICGDYLKLIPKLKADVVFLAPPWGGVDYINVDEFDIATMIQPNGMELFRATLNITPNIAYCLPRNINPEQIREMATLSPLPINDVSKLSSSDDAPIAPAPSPTSPSNSLSSSSSFSTFHPPLVCELEENRVNGKIKMMTAYFGELVRPPDHDHDDDHDHDATNIQAEVDVAGANHDNAA